MTSTTPTIQSASLQFREGNSDNSAGASRPIQQTARRVHSGTADGGKEYHAAIEPDGEGYIVTFSYGRRGNTLTTGTKTP